MEYPPEKKTETLNHVLHTMKQFPVIFLGGGYFHPQAKNIKKINPYLKSIL
jgi:hypothetical protein